MLFVTHWLVHPLSFFSWFLIWSSTSTSKRNVIWIVFEEVASLVWWRLFVEVFIFQIHCGGVSRWFCSCWSSWISGVMSYPRWCHVLSFRCKSALARLVLPVVFCLGARINLALRTFVVVGFHVIEATRSWVTSVSWRVLPDVCVASVASVPPWCDPYDCGVVCQTPVTKGWGWNNDWSDWSTT